MSDKVKDKWLRNTEDFIAKLEQLNYVKPDGNTIISEDGYEVSYSTELMGSPPHRGDYPVQIVIRVRKNGHHVQTWGCDSNEANRLFVNFFIKARARAYEVEHTNDKEIRDRNEKEFWEL